MFQGNRHFLVSLTVAAFSALVSAPVGAQSSGAGDAKEISGYKLTDEGLARYLEASQSLQALPAMGAGDCDSDDSENGTTIDQAVARLNAAPGVSAALKAAGMTTREYVVIGMAVFESGMASWALTQPGAKLPAGVSMDNVNFYRKHETELTKAGAGKQSANCEDG